MKEEKENQKKIIFIKMGVDVFCDSLQACLDSTLSAEDITKNINKFFMNLLIRTLNLDEIKEKVVKLLFSSKALDLDEWEKLLKENILDNEAVQTSNKVVKTALDDAKAQYGDSTLPFISLYLLSNSNLDTFIEAFKYINLAKNGVNTVQDVKDMVETIQNSTSIFSGIVTGIKTAVKANEVIKQAFDPNLIKKEDLKRLTSYYLNFITVLPVNIIDEFGEFGPVYENITRILITAFDKKFRDEFVENTLFSNYKDSETINVKDFFTDNYEALKNDRKIRINMVQAYIKTLNPLDELLKPRTITIKPFNAESEANPK
jgi:uncharacterized protein (UPF0297 family)